MADITEADVVYVSTSKNGDYVSTVPHEGAVAFYRPHNLMDAFKTIPHVSDRMKRINKNSTKVA